ncbi:hypothetical protein CGSSp4595_1207 [Streptococcus pneumoniae 459-5]|nr:hypothetical protein SPAR85_1313 [Streptococcus pneumoniae GA44500]EHD77268.1 hypothetical protein SPAR82_1253 [Streptococcus pneumoniae GA44378]EHZ17965.1 hypothetical protein SPAR29_1242 [Streptococcus pneumoniae GA13430]EIC57025.1 hypothetical protein CGSSp4595_1207 [Streptococcus pneumoniae 459-5]
MEFSFKSFLTISNILKVLSKIIKFLQYLFRVDKIRKEENQF